MAYALSIRPGRGGPFESARDRLGAKRRKASRRGFDINHAWSRVPSGQFKRAMSHELLNDSRGATGLVGQGRALATKRVEIEDESPRVAVGDSDLGQVDLEHVRSTVGHGEDALTKWDRFDKPRQIVREIRRVGKRCGFAILGVTGLNGDSRPFSVEAKRLGRDALDF